MNVWIVSYSANGAATAERIAAGLRGDAQNCRCFALEKYRLPGVEPLTGDAQSWAGDAFREADALIFCAAAGIAVRAIAPHLKGKAQDPAVLVTDELGHFVIPLLSGHLGGANELALRIASSIQAEPILTTATDIHGVFAVDLFAKKNHLWIEDLHLAKKVSASVLSGEPVGFTSDIRCVGRLPAELTSGAAQLGIAVTNDIAAAPYAETLRLIPRRYVAGIGCRRGKSAADLASFLEKRLAESNLRIRDLRGIASVDLKKDEAGLIELCKQNRLEFLTYSAEELAAVPGEFTSSEFVRSVAGVESVAERAAVRASGGKLVRRKVGEDGMTFALAIVEEDIRFE